MANIDQCAQVESLHTSTPSVDALYFLCTSKIHFRLKSNDSIFDYFFVSPSGML